MKSVSIIDDVDDIRKSFEFIINSLKNYEVVSTFNCCEDSISEFKKRGTPDIILMDISLPGMDGIAGTREIKKIDNTVDIIIISVHEDSELVFKALYNGAVGYLTKSADFREIADALDEVSEGGSPMSSKIARMVAQSFHSNIESPLTSRELEILRQIAKGKSYAEISGRLHISVETTKSHINNIYRKLEVKNKIEALNKAKDNHMI